MSQKYDGGDSKDSHRRTDNKSWINAYEPKAKQQSNMWAFEHKPNPSWLWKNHFEAKLIIDTKKFMLQRSKIEYLSKNYIFNKLPIYFW